jgi:hypothetical protein
MLRSKRQNANNVNVRPFFGMIKVWKVSWSIMGNILAVSQGDNKVSLWKVRFLHLGAHPGNKIFYARFFRSLSIESG